MNTIKRSGMLAGVLVMGLVGLIGSVGRADDDDDKKDIEAAKKAIEPMLGAVGAPDFDKQAKMLTTKQMNEYLMKAAFRTRTKGGIGIGKLKESHKDSIELLIKDYAGKVPPTKNEVTNNNADLMKVAKVITLMSHTTPYYAPAKDKGKETKAAWLGFSEDMKKASITFMEAVKAKDEKALVTASKKLDKSCVDCHAVFRVAN